MGSKNAFSFLLATCLVFLPHVSALAQSQTTGRIVGVIKDPSGALVAGADVTVNNEATGEERKTSADGLGSYSVPLLPPGAYHVRVAAPGFQSTVFTGVGVAVTETTQVDADLVIGPTAQSVMVSAASPLVQMDGPQLGRVVGSRALAQLPLATRNFTQILGLSPGTATFLPDSTAVGRNSQAVSVNGARVTQNSIQINGVDANLVIGPTAQSVMVSAASPLVQMDGPQLGRV
ncbi:MAG: carboxypeptidase-like regulatory domain-containing protein, partial [Terriglobia bacterium]